MKKTLGIGVALLTLLIVLLVGKWAMVARDTSQNEMVPLVATTTLYSNSEYGISFSYPTSVTAETEFKKFYHLSSDWRVGSMEHMHGTPLVAIPLYRLDNGGVYVSYPMYYDAELRVGVSTDTQDVIGCLTDSAENNFEMGITPTTTMINGVMWTKVPVGSGGMMQYVYGNSYRVLRGASCITIETLKAGSNYRDTPTLEDISDADLESHYSSLDAILGTVHVDFAGVHCGGNIRNAPTCPSDYHCQLKPAADLGGSCVPN